MKIIENSLLAFLVFFSLCTTFLSCSKDDDLMLVEELGLGKNLQNEKSNNVPYEWYIDQGSTGEFSFINCGPSSVTMAIKWADESFSKTTEDARNTYQPTGGWWYTSDIRTYLNDYQIANATVSLNHIMDINQHIDDGNIIILCLDIFYVREEQNPKHHLDKFYSTASKDAGHFIVVKGYKIVDDNLFYEVYDPWSLGLKYNDGSLKGKDRYYRAEDLNIATQAWWKYAIIVSPKGISRSGLNKIQGVDVDKIEDKYGGIKVN